MAHLLLVDHSDAPAVPAAALGADERHVVTTVAHGPEALSQLACGHFDLVVVSVRVPDRDGVALAQIIRERPTHAALPIIAVTETMTVREHVALLLAGIDRVVTMPSPIAVLRRAIEQALAVPERLPSLLEAYARVCRRLEPRPAPARAVSMDELRRLEQEFDRYWLEFLADVAVLAPARREWRGEWT